MDGVAVRRIDDVRGRGLVALRDFAPEETIFREVPLVLCQYAYNKVGAPPATRLRAHATSRLSRSAVGGRAPKTR